MKAFIAVFLFLMIQPKLVEAEQLTIGGFKKSCRLTEEVNSDKSSPKELIGNLQCINYVEGVIDGLVVSMAIGGGRKLFCLPAAGVNPDGTIRMIRDFISSRKLPDNNPIRGTIAAAYANYFPCPIQQ